jgi:hypothetical protein
MTGVTAFERAEPTVLAAELPTGFGCDFCASGAPAWRYPAADVGLGTIVVDDRVLRPISLGAWRACEECSALIEAGDWPALARHALRSLGLDLSQTGPGVRVGLLAEIRCAHEAFRRARSGRRELLPMAGGRALTP